MNNAVGKYRHDGSDTQVAAAYLIRPVSGTQRQRVLNAIVHAGPVGRTDHELQELLRMNASSERPRRVELVEQGWIEDSGRRRLTTARREAIVWVATESGAFKHTVLEGIET